MINEISLNQYRIFYAAAECGSISRAAEKLFISQPAISRAVSLLEDSLGVKLFRRGRKGVTLTDEGSVLYGHLKNAFSEINAAESYIRGLVEKGGGHLRIGASAVLCRHMLLPYLKGFGEENPQIRITIDCQSSVQTDKMLESGSIDLALMVRPQDLTGKRFISLGSISDVLTAAPAFLDRIGFSVSSPLSSEEINLLIERAGGIMLLDTRNGTRRHIDRYFSSNGIAAERSGILEVSGMDMLIEFAGTGLGLACVIRSFIEDDIKSGRLMEIPIKNPIGSREVGFVVNERQTPFTAEKFLEFIEN
ncbi:MAG: LysR family transcriptional regulator [Oscillospiraceae bacterium]|nr:LysR family transcriptional regulator [Oscillospiraceae bacterium]